MEFEWDEEKRRANRSKHGVDFDTAKEMWNDSDRVEVQISYPFEDRSILIGKMGNKLWTAIFTHRCNAIRIISVRRARKKEIRLYEKQEDS
jgi:uncharacterized DUF497 family protein